MQHHPLATEELHAVKELSAEPVAGTMGRATGTGMAREADHAMISMDDMDEEDQGPRKYERHPSRDRHACCTRFGRTWVLYSCSPQYGYFPLTAHVGPNWPFMLVTYAIALAPILIVILKADALRFGFRVAMLLSSAITTVIFTLVACSDPGVVFQSYEVNSLDVAPMEASGVPVDAGVICASCQIRRPKDASHCSDCGVCVRGLDHHCPWTGKCIGQRTLYLFYVFLVCISIHVVLLGISLALSYLTS